MEKRLINPSIRIYLNKRENKITFTIKTGYYLELLTPETMGLLRSIRNKIIKDENGENVPRLKFAEVVLIHCNIANNNNYQQDCSFVPNKSFDQLLDISPKKYNYIFLVK